MTATVQPELLGPLTRERMERLVRIYHHAVYAAEATGHCPRSLCRAARRYGLAFRQAGEITERRNTYAQGRAT